MLAMLPERPTVRSCFRPFALLQLLPLLADLLRRIYPRTVLPLRGIHVRVAEDELVAQLITDIRNIKGLLLLPYLGIETDVKQHISKFFADVFVVIVDKSVTEFIRLLYRIGAQTLVRLLAVPGTFLPQRVQHVQQTAESRHFLFSCMHNLFTGIFSAKVRINLHIHYRKPPEDWHNATACGMKSHTFRGVTRYFPG